MTTAPFDIEYSQQQFDLTDTIAWDDIYARACRRACDTGFAQLILESGPADYRLIDGAAPDWLKLRRLRGAKIHVILDWEA